ncbi:caspase-3-like isoform X1 [Haliotis asinina]|uniref:caspase-3-like isoform X1 n=2 Tax=Haliotis asinina TaxID=109174 RepID=UPI0035320B11
MADDSMDPDEKDFGLGSFKRLSEFWKSCVSDTLMPRVDNQKEMDNPDQYNFGHSQRGVALIVCNENFQHMQSRAGADLDAESFYKIFRKLGFEDIRTKYDMTDVEMRHWFTAVSQEDHSQCDCLAVAITSHGEKYSQVDPKRYNVLIDRDTILGSQGAVYTEELVEMFSDRNCPSLTGKPRIFLLQACRGERLDQGVTVTDDMDVVDALTEPEYTISPAPCFKDFCVVYATPPGFYAFRRPTSGSWFVTGLRDVIENTDLKKYNFLQLMTKVINRVAREFESHSPQRAIDGKKQSGCIYSMLTKDVYFSPKPLGEEPL